LEKLSGEGMSAISQFVSSSSSFSESDRDLADVCIFGGNTSHDIVYFQCDVIDR
jgi:hypothetical protein